MNGNKKIDDYSKYSFQQAVMFGFVIILVMTALYWLGRLTMFIILFA